MILRYLIFSLLAFSIHATAQQDILYTQYMFNGLTINPAYAGNHNALSVSGMTRKQWIGIDGAPSTFLISAHMPFINDKVGLGLMISQDKIGVGSKVQATMAYSYKIIKEDKRFSFGIQAMVLSYSQLYNQLDNINEQDKNFQENYQQTLFNVGAGIFYETKRYYIGFSVPQIIRNYYEPNNPASDKQLRQYIFTGGYEIYLHPLVKFKPNFLIRYNEELPSNYGLGANLLYNEKIWLGFSYGYQNSISALLGLMLTDKMKIGFAYDYLTNGLQKAAKGSVEMMVNYRFLKSKKQDAGRSFDN
jgi:type IX secretion system PorP/SprF family membrane protein